MTLEEFAAAIRHIQDTVPGDWPNDIEPMLEYEALLPSPRGEPRWSQAQLFPEGEAAWNAYDYNPGEFSGSFAPDEDTRATVRPKPTWAELQAAAAASRLSFLKVDAPRQIQAEEARRICAAYIGDQDVPQTIEQEILYRLRASDTDLAPKDTERDRLRGKAVALRTWINDDMRTQSELEAFDPTADSHWAKPNEGD